ncbi:MAG: molybdenum cofactor guanylyltransferase [Sphingobium sp.]|nr:molybdenum cofactor guanylyltransferase [Sphingobium sp.]
MTILGAVLAGGRSRRFGGDKALAEIDGKPMIAHIIDALGPQVDALVMCGRDWPGLERIEDRPEEGLGPLGGLNAALHHALTRGHAGVLCVPVDVLPLPGDLAVRLAGDGAAVFARQHAVGYWPARLAPLLDDMLASGERRIEALIAAAGARRVEERFAMRNINRPEDLLWSDERSD